MLSYLKYEIVVWFEIIMLFIFGQNDEFGEIEVMSCWIMDNLGVDVLLYFFVFYLDYKMKDILAILRVILNWVWKIVMEQGLNYVYMGNVYDQVGDCIYCLNCYFELIQWDWYQFNSWLLVLGG